MKKKDLRIILGISILLVAFATVYYFVFYIPQYNERNFILQQEEKCHGDAQKYLIKDYTSSLGAEESHLIQTKFNKKDNSCIIHFYETNPPAYTLLYENIVSIWNKIEFIGSIMCEKDLGSLYYRNGFKNDFTGTMCNNSKEDFFKKKFEHFFKIKKEIFGE